MAMNLYRHPSLAPSILGEELYANMKTQTSWDVSFLFLFFFFCGLKTCWDFSLNEEPNN